MRIVDDHQEFWKSVVKVREEYLTACHQSDKPKAIQEMHLCRQVYDALGNLKEFLDNHYKK